MCTADWPLEKSCRHGNGQAKSATFVRATRSKTSSPTRILFVRDMIFHRGKTKTCVWSEIANAEVPENLEEMCASSRECVGQIVVCLDKAVISCEGIITSQDAVSRSLQELVGMTTEMLNDENCLHRSEREADQKFAERYVNKTRLDPTHEVLQWFCFDFLFCRCCVTFFIDRGLFFCFFNRSELNKQTSQTLRLHTLPVLRKSLNDIRVMNEAIIIRDKLRSDHDLAQTIAAKWKTEAAKTNLRTNQVEQKHRDEQFEMETKELSELVSKVVLSQLNLVCCVSA